MQEVEELSTQLRELWRGKQSLFVGGIWAMARVEELSAQLRELQEKTTIICGCDWARA